MWPLARSGLAALCLLGACRRVDPWPATTFEARRIYNACQAYASVNGRLPTTLEELVPDYLQERAALADPDHPEAGEIGYYYFGSGGTGAEEPRTIFLASKAERQGQRALIRFSGEATVARFKPPHP